MANLEMITSVCIIDNMQENEIYVFDTRMSLPELEKARKELLPELEKARSELDHHFQKK